MSSFIFIFKRDDAARCFSHYPVVQKINTEILLKKAIYDVIKRSPAKDLFYAR